MVKMEVVMDICSLANQGYSHRNIARLTGLHRKQSKSTWLKGHSRSIKKNNPGKANCSRGTL